jgi:stringent starvation protein B
MTECSVKSYLVRAVHEWACDGGLTPYLAVRVDAQTRVPMEHVKDGQIVLNLSHGATHKLIIDQDYIRFSARFSGVSRDCLIPMSAVQGLFGRESGEGLFFEPNGGIHCTIPLDGTLPPIPPAGGTLQSSNQEKSPAKDPSALRGNHLKVIK